MLYWSDPPHTRNRGLGVVISNPLFASTAFVEESVGTEYPTCAVTASGLKNFIESGRNPKPLPANSFGVRVVNESAPTALLPVPPQSTSSDADIANSPSASLTNWYLKAVARLSKPAWLPPPGTLRCTQSSPKDTPRFSMIVFEYSPEMSSSGAEGSSPFLNDAIVGSDNSS